MNEPKKIFQQLPVELRSYDLWLYGSDTDVDGRHAGAAQGLREHRQAVQEWLDIRFEGVEGVPNAEAVCTAGGLTFDAWFRRIFTDEPRLRVV